MEEIHDRQTEFDPLAMQEKQTELDNLLRHDADQSMVWSRLHEYSLYEGLNPNYVDPQTLRATIHLCAYEGEEAILRWCLATGADVNARTALGRTPLHYACIGNQPLCVTLLIAKGADVMPLTVAQWTPLHFCCHYKGYDAVAALLAGATASRKIIDVDAVDKDGVSPQALTDEVPILHAIANYTVTLDAQ